jgi:hypothetical protein
MTIFITTFFFLFYTSPRKKGAKATEGRIQSTSADEDEREKEERLTD